MTVDHDNRCDGEPCRIFLTAPLAAAEYLEGVLEAFCQATLCEPAADDRTARIIGFARHRPEGGELADALAAAAARIGIPNPHVEVGPEPVCDWLALNRETFKPFRVGRFYIAQTSEPPLAPPPPDAIALRINPGLAFGSGRHASTAGCLLALSKFPFGRPLFAPGGGPATGVGLRLQRSILDLGCGSGILAIAAAKLWYRPVLAVDIDPVAVEVATANARENGVFPLVRAVVAQSTRHPTIRRFRPYQLILANILARPLRQMAPAIARLSTAGTLLVIAGFVEDDARRVAAVYSSHRFRRLNELTIDGWSTLVLVRQ